MRILVVEDDQLLNKTLSYNLSAVGYSVDGAMSKAVAIRFLEKQDYDLIVLDVNLPDGNGFDICHEVKERRPDTAVIFLTANDMESDMLKGFELGADDYVTKPFPISVFQKKVSALLNRISAQSGGDFYDDGNLYINFSELSACLAGQPITLTSLEYRLLKVLTRNSQTVLTRQVLLEKLWDVDENYVDGELVKTCTILAKACTVGTEDETPTTTTATMHIGGDAPFVYLPDTVFKQIYTTPTLLNYGFNMDASLHPQMEDFLSSYVEKNPSVTYTSTKLLKEQLNSVASMVLVVGSLIGCIMALVGLINFTNMIITNIITRRHEFATMQSIGMTNRQLQRLMVYEGVYYAAGADIIGGVVALLLAVTVLKNVLNSPSMWFFTMNITLVPVLVIGVLYLLLAAVIPLIVLHFFNKGTVVERLRTSE